VLALVAYVAASGKPDLWVKIRFTFCEPNEAVFKVGPPRPGDGWIPLIEPMKQGLAQVELYNRATYSAHNPGVRIQLVGISVADRYIPDGKRPMLSEARLAKLKADQAIEGWTALKAINMIGPTVYQWDGGADQIIHAKWSRTLPSFDMRGAHIISGASVVMLSVTIVADDVSPIHQDIAVKTLNAQQWNEWVVDRSMPVETGAVVLRELATSEPGNEPSLAEQTPDGEEGGAASN
jgi:hypothetical protein